MASERQIAANRKNALRSTGPKTQAGKARASLNALKFGIYSAHFLTPDENEEDFLRLMRTYLAHYQPRGEMEELQVLELLQHQWRLGRYARMEAEILTVHGYERDGNASDVEYHYEGTGWGFTRDCGLSRSVSALNQVEVRTFRKFEKLKQMLDKSLKRHSLFGSPSIAVQGASSSPEPSPGREHAQR
jgi:hypothetical protein